VGVDDSVILAMATAVGPVGVGVLAAVWMLTRRRENGSQIATRTQVLETLSKLDASVGHISDEISEVKTDIREVRQAVTQHLQDHPG
jgi:thiamine kinase-like enzyme